VPIQNATELMSKCKNPEHHHNEQEEEEGGSGDEAEGKEGKGKGKEGEGEQHATVEGQEASEAASTEMGGPEDESSRDKRNSKRGREPCGHQKNPIFFFFFINFMEFNE
jgi:hypothetical protein